jgi:hypothetical protein
VSAPQAGGPSRLERALPLALGALFLALEILDCSRWHPGFSYLDEGSGAVCNLQEWIEGRSLPFELFKGCVHGHLSAWMSLILGPSMWDFRVLSLGALALESVLLYRLALDMAGRRPALWALAANFACAQVFLRARFALSCTLLPAELLLFLTLMRREWGAAASLAFGAAAAFLLVDYEGWLVALPVLALYWACLDPRERPRWGGALLGFALILLFLVWESKEGLGDHVSRRLRSLPESGFGPGLLLMKFLKSFLLGGDCIPYLGVSGRSFVPAWAIPGFLAGCALALRRKPMLLAWLLLGLLPSLTISASAEPNRIVAAWPALSILCGLGLAWMAQRLGPWPMILILGLGLWWEGTGYVASMQAGYGPWFSESAALQRLSLDYPRRRLINELGPPYASQQRFAWGPRRDPQGEVFLISDDYAPGLGKSGQMPMLHPVGLGGLEYTDAPPAPLAQRLLAVDASLRDLRRGLPRFAYKRHRDLLLQWLMQGQGDPWMRTAVLEEALTWSSSLGELPPTLVQSALSEPLVSASSPLWLADKAHQSGDDRFARRLCLRAHAIDPRRACAY